MPDDATLLARFLSPDGRLTAMPAKRHPRMVVLRQCAELVPAGEDLTEAEVNDRLRVVSDDVAMLRRYLVDEGLVQRRPPGVYRRAVTVVPDDVALRVLRPEDWRDWRELRLQALTEAPYAFGSTLADWQGAGDVEQRWRDRLDGGSHNLLAALDGRPAGMASGMPTGDPATVELISMWVAPFARGRGVTDVLVDAVVGWAGKRGADRVVLRVVETNEYAVAAYRRLGFADTGVVEEDSGRGVREREMARPLR